MHHDNEEVEGAARQPVDAHRGYHIIAGEAVKHQQKLAPVGPRARRLLAVDVPAAAPGGAALARRC
jgi:hypothetical protein